MSEGGYIQGAGDDSEGWSQGLTPPIFWANRDTLLANEESNLPEVIQKLVHTHDTAKPTLGATLIYPTNNLYIGQSDVMLEECNRFDLSIDCHKKEDTETGQGCENQLLLGCSSAKLGSRDLRKAFDTIKIFAEKNLTQNPSQKLLVTCETGKDLSVGVVLAIICLFYDDEGKFYQVLPIFFILTQQPNVHYGT